MNVPALQTDFPSIVGPIHWTLTATNGTLWGNDVDCALSAGVSPPRDVDTCVASFTSQLAPNGSMNHGIVLMHDYIRVPDTGSTSCTTSKIDPDWPVKQAGTFIPWLKQHKYLLLPLDAVPELPGGQKLPRLGAMDGQLW